MYLKIQAPKMKHLVHKFNEVPRVDTQKSEYAETLVIFYILSLLSYCISIIQEIRFQGQDELLANKQQYYVCFHAYNVQQNHRYCHKSCKPTKRTMI